MYIPNLKNPTLASRLLPYFFLPVPRPPLPAQPPGSSASCGFGSHPHQMVFQPSGLIEKQGLSFDLRLEVTFPGAISNPHVELTLSLIPDLDIQSHGWLLPPALLSCLFSSICSWAPKTLCMLCVLHLQHLRIPCLRV